MLLFRVAGQIVERQDRDAGRPAFEPAPMTHTENPVSAATRMPATHFHTWPRTALLDGACVRT
jgi:hypothetical protein